jgi:hypothetical protein
MSDIFVSTGDGGGVAFCVDYFSPITARNFRVTFDMDDINFPDGYQEALLYEFSIYGVENRKIQSLFFFRGLF